MGSEDVGDDTSEGSGVQQKPFKRVYSFMSLTQRLGSVRMLSCALCKCLINDHWGHSLWHANRQEYLTGPLTSYRDHNVYVTVRRLDSGELFAKEGL